MKVYDYQRFNKLPTEEEMKQLGADGWLMLGRIAGSVIFCKEVVKKGGKK